MKNRFNGDRSSGIPVFFILEPDGTVVADSFGPNGNIGGPVSEEEIAFFGEIMQKAAINMTAREIEQLVEILIVHCEERSGR
jgi:hypothetical protein